MFAVLSFYKFINLSDEAVTTLKSALEEYATAKNLRGLIILANEGINGTVAGLNSTAQAFKEFIHFALSQNNSEGVSNILLEYKESSAERQPFRRFRVKVRPEIVTLGVSDLEINEHESALTPEEWHAELQKDEPYYLLDTRNGYETKLGMFRGAIDPQISNFAELTERLPELKIPKDAKVLMYCTGGIRCEKALPLLKSAGYERVHQLSGGILNYMEKYPEGYFDGECFVFDHRVSVDAKLRPSERYSLCPLCGNPAESTISCDRCSKESRVCDDCIEKNRSFCSIRCENELAFEQSRTSTRV